MRTITQSGKQWITRTEGEMTREYDVTTARQEFDYYTTGWRDCSAEGLRRIRANIVLIAQLLPKDDPRHLIVNEILEKIQGRETHE